MEPLGQGVPWKETFLEGLDKNGANVTIIDWWRLLLCVCVCVCVNIVI